MISRALIWSVPIGMVLAAGCISTTLTREAERVLVVRNPNAVRHCEVLGEVASASPWGGPAGARGLENNKRMLRNETARRGGDTVLILEEEATLVLPHTYGTAYRCAPRGK
jgi:hypothetical protein